MEHREQFHWNTRSRSYKEQLHWSSSFLGANTAALLEHTEQRLSGSRHSCYTRARGGAELSEHTERAALMMHLQQWRCCICFQRGAAPCDPAKLLSVLWVSSRPMWTVVSAPRELLLHVIQHSCSLCSWEAAAPCAPLEQVYMLLESRCCMCSSRAAAALCPLGRSCSVCSSETAVCVPRK